MKNKIFMRCSVGSLVGVAISFLITVAISLMKCDGIYYPVVPELVSDFGNEITAVCVQTLCSLLYGAAFGGASLIWEAERWSLLRMTLTHLVVCSLGTFPIAYFMRWMPHSIIGVAVYMAIFFGVYAIIWIVQYRTIKKRIQKLNEKIKGNSVLT